METEVIQTAAELAHRNEWVAMLTTLGSIAIVCGTIVYAVLKVWARKPSASSVSHEQIIERINQAEKQRARNVEEIKGEFREFKRDYKDDMKEFRDSVDQRVDHITDLVVKAVSK